MDFKAGEILSAYWRVQEHSRVSKIEISAPDLEMVEVTSIKIHNIEYMIYGPLTAFTMNRATFEGLATVIDGITIQVKSAVRQSVGIQVHFGKH